LINLPLRNLKLNFILFELFVLIVKRIVAVVLCIWLISITISR